jgi:hypothetical protein
LNEQVTPLVQASFPVVIYVAEIRRGLLPMEGGRMILVEMGRSLDLKGLRFSIDSGVDSGDLVGRM